MTLIFSISIYAFLKIKQIFLYFITVLSIGGEEIIPAGVVLDAHELTPI